MDYPPNSNVSKAAGEKKVERVNLSGDPIRRKPPLGKQFKSVFIGGDAKTTMQYVIFDVLIPAARDMIYEVGSQGLHRLMFGESRRKGPGSMSGPAGHFSYNRVPMGGVPASAPRQLSRRARSLHDFDEIVLPSRVDAEEVIDRLFDMVSQYEEASVADLYNLVGLTSSHTDHKWGWTDMRGATVTKVRGSGYLLDLPEPEPLRR